MFEPSRIRERTKEAIKEMRDSWCPGLLARMASYKPDRESGNFFFLLLLLLQPRSDPKKQSNILVFLTSSPQLDQSKLTNLANNLCAARSSARRMTFAAYAWNRVGGGE